MGSLQVKPANPYRTTISPSSLYKGRCARCTWLSYWHNFSLPSNLNLSQKLSRLQESFFDGAPREVLFSETTPSEVRSSVGNGKLKLFKGRITSDPIKINDENTRWAFKGELDFVVEEFHRFTGIIDAKVSLKNDESVLAEDYEPQLHAYIYMLENSSEESAIKLALPECEIKSIGILQWRIYDVNSVHPGVWAYELGRRNDWGFRVEHRYIPIERNDLKFHKFIENFINIIEGEFPEPASDCIDCGWLVKNGFQY